MAMHFYYLISMIYPQNLKASAHLFQQISRVLKLTKVQEVAVALALLSSCRPDLGNFALLFAKQKLPELIRSYVDVGELYF